MIYELLYTSAPAGLRPGSSGYCTVQSSRGIPAPTVDLLESLSGYRHVYTAGTPDAAHNPVNFGHYVLRVQGRSQHVLSRVSDCPLDHTGRSNKIGHHMVVDDPDGIPAGPAWLMQQPGWMIDRWDGQVTTLNTVRKAPNSKRPAGVCTGWKQATGDAGWAGVLAEAFQKNPDRKVFVIYKPGTNLLALFEEALALLPAARRWDVTFSTYGAALPATVDCVWNGVISGSQEEHLSKRFVNALRIDLTKPPGPAPEAGPLVELARSGKLPSQPTAPQQPQHATHAAAPASVSAADVVSDSFTRVADPVVPPPVRRPVHKMSGNMRLILALLACCLLFGGGTAAGVVYFLQKDKPVVVAEVEEVAEKDKLEEENLSPQRKVNRSQAPPSHMIPEDRDATSPSDPEPAMTSHDNQAPEDGITTAKKDEADGITTEVATGKEHKKEKLATAEKPREEESPIEQIAIQLIAPYESVALQLNAPNTLEIPEYWDDSMGDLVAVQLLIPQPRKAGSGSGHDISVKTSDPVQTSEPDYTIGRNVEYTLYPFTVSVDKKDVFDCAAWVRGGVLKKVEAKIKDGSRKALMLNAAVGLEYQKSVVAIPMRTPVVVDPLEHVAGSKDKAKGTFDIKWERTTVYSPPEMFLPERTHVSDSLKLFVGTETFEFKRDNKDVGVFLSTGRNVGKMNVEIAIETKNVGGTTNDIVHAYHYDIRPLFDQAVAIDAEATSLRDELSPQWDAIVKEIARRTQQSEERFKSEFLDPEGSGARIATQDQLQKEISSLLHLAGRVFSKKEDNKNDGKELGTVTFEYVESFVSGRNVLARKYAESDLIRENAKSCSIGGFYVENRFKFIHSSNESIQFSAPIFTVRSQPQR